MTYQNLALLQNGAQTVFALCLFGGLAFLILGMIRPRWVRFNKRRYVILSTIAVWFLGAAAYGGAIAYTHSQPNGPHAFNSYMDTIAARTCAQNPQHHSCPKLREKCETGDATHPSCRILAGEPAEKFITTKVRN